MLNNPEQPHLPDSHENETEGLSFDMQNINSICEYAQRMEYPTCESMESSLARVAEQLRDTKGIVELEHQDLPTIIVPDLHARRDFLVDALGYQIDGKSVLELLQEGRINVVCLGDGMHAESRAKNRWREAEFDTDKLDEEMAESLGTMQMIMELKSAFPQYFHYIRGNHDEIGGEFHKYADESQQVRDWIKKHYGEDFIRKYADFEDSLPLMAVGANFIASHAAPMFDSEGKHINSPTIEQIQKKDSYAINALTWGNNTGRIGEDETQFLIPAVKKMLAGLGKPEATWFIGHRRADATFHPQADGRLIQINDPQREIIAVVPGAGSSFDAYRDIKVLGSVL